MIECSSRSPRQQPLVNCVLRGPPLLDSSSLQGSHPPTTSLSKLAWPICHLLGINLFGNYKWRKYYSFVSPLLVVGARIDGFITMSYLLCQLVYCSPWSNIRTNVRESWKSKIIDSNIGLNHSSLIFKNDYLQFLFDILFIKCEIAQINQ